MDKEKRRQEDIRVYDAAFELFVKKKIERVKMEEIAVASGIGVATVYRHYHTKLELAAKVCAYKWQQYFADALKGRTPEYLKNVTTIERLEFTFDSYIDMYKNHKDLLRFNDDFNHFYHENKKAEHIPEYENAFNTPTARFHDMYERAKTDGTMRTDIPEDELQRVLFHTMMGACSHYLGGFSWGEKENQDYSGDLVRLKNILMNFAKGK